jgi:hypothetical protein
VPVRLSTSEADDQPLSSEVEFARRIFLSGFLFLLSFAAARRGRFARFEMALAQALSGWISRGGGGFGSGRRHPAARPMAERRRALERSVDKAMLQVVGTGKEPDTAAVPCLD